MSKTNLTVVPDVVDVYVLKEEIKKKLAILEEFEQVDLEYKKAKENLEKVKEKRVNKLKQIDLVNLFLPDMSTINSFKELEVKKESDFVEIKETINEKEPEIGIGIGTGTGFVKLNILNAFVTEKYYNNYEPEHFINYLKDFGYTSWYKVPKDSVVAAIMPILNIMEKISVDEYKYLQKASNLKHLPNFTCLVRVFGSWNNLLNYIGLKKNVNSEKSYDEQLELKSNKKEKIGNGKFNVYSDFIISKEEAKEISLSLKSNCWTKSVTKKELLSLLVYYINKKEKYTFNCYKKSYNSFEFRLPSDKTVRTIFGSWCKMLETVGFELL
jgi:hypothetical protein